MENKMYKINEDGIDREMTKEENTNHESYVKQQNEQEQALLKVKEATAAAKAALLARLGITADEAKLLLG
jgi:hypothetical protein